MKLPEKKRIIKESVIIILFIAIVLSLSLNFFALQKINSLKDILYSGRFERWREFDHPIIDYTVVEDHEFDKCKKDFMNGFTSNNESVGSKSKILKISGMRLSVKDEYDLGKLAYEINLLDRMYVHDLRDSETEHGLYVFPKNWGDINEVAYIQCFLERQEFYGESSIWTTRVTF